MNQTSKISFFISQLIRNVFSKATFGFGHQIKCLAQYKLRKYFQNLPQLVCDDVDNCAGGEDEQSCNVIHFLDREKYRLDKPPVQVMTEDRTKVSVPLRINCTLTVVDLVNIDDSKGLFSIIFRWDGIENM